MTPAALEVLCDAAREGGATEEEVARVRLGEDMLDALCLLVELYGRDLDVDDRVVFAFVDRVLLAVHGRGVFASQQRGYVVQQSDLEPRIARLQGLHREPGRRTCPRRELEAQATLWRDLYRQASAESKLTDCVEVDANYVTSAPQGETP